MQGNKTGNQMDNVCYQWVDGLFRNVEMGVAFFCDARLVYANVAFARALACQSPGALLGQPVRSLFVDFPVADTAGTRYALEAHPAWGGNVLSAEILLVDQPGGPATMVLLRSDISAEEAEHLYVQANYDSLTGLPNRSLFNDRLKHALAKATRYQTELALMYIDLIQFKQVNDTLGHGVGDELLKRVALKLSSVTRGADTVARLAGDEFVILLEETASMQTATAVAAKTIRLLSQPFQVQQQKIRVGASIGIALYPGDGTTAEALLQIADQAMYRAKAKGYSCFACSLEPPDAWELSPGHDRQEGTGTG